MKTALPEIVIPKRQLVVFLLLIFSLNLLFLAGTWTLQEYHHIIPAGSQEELQLAYNRPSFIFLQQLDLASENVAATWYSSMLLLMIAVTCLLCFFSDKVKFHHPKDKALSYGWLVLGLIFGMLSLDEIGSFHETIGDSAVLGFFGSDIGWTIFYGIIALVGLYMVGFGFIRLRSNIVAFVASIVGALFYLSNPFQEYIEVDSMHAALDAASWKRPMELLLLEEGTEIFGSWSFLLATLVFLFNPKGVKQGKPFAATIPIPYTRRQILAIVLTLVSVLSFSLAAALLYDTGPKNVEEGILKNWYPSALTLLVSLYSLFQVNIKTSSGKAHLALVFLGIGLSAFYGSNIFEHYFFWGTGLKSGLLFRGGVIFTSAAIAFVLWKEAKLNVRRITVALWAISLSFAFLLGKETSLQFTFLAYFLLAISFAVSQTVPVVSFSPLFRVLRKAFAT